MKVLRYTDKDYARRVKEMASASSLFDQTVEARTRGIIDAVRERGDQALIEYTQRFDKAELTPEQIRVSPEELAAAKKAADPALRDAIAAADRNVAAFAEKSLRKDWSASNEQGASVGEKFDAIQRVGAYIPGGMAPLVSTALMTITLARVAGCPEIVACTPCDRKGAVNPALLYAVQVAGATEVYRIGGAQAITAMALGTPSIRKVHKIFGPGNAYVVMAKRLLFGHVGIDLLPGPSELLVLADDTARASNIASDLLAQAEHGSGFERVWFVTNSSKLIELVQEEVEKQAETLERRTHIKKILAQNAWLVQVKDIEAGVALANELAPEHCEVMTRNARKVSAGIITAGALFLGDWTPTVLGDYVAGPSHTLPTGGAGTSFPGLTVDQFQRRTSIVEYDKVSLKKSLALVQKIASLEGLSAHGNSASIRFE